MAYQLIFPTRNIEKKFEKFKKKLSESDRSRVRESILSLQNNPRPQGKVWKKLGNPVQVFALTAEYRIRVGNYRVLYDIDDERKRIILLAIRRKSENTYE